MGHSSFRIQIHHHLRPCSPFHHARWALKTRGFLSIKMRNLLGKESQKLPTTHPTNHDFPFEGVCGKYSKPSGALPKDPQLWLNHLSDHRANLLWNSAKWVQLGKQHSPFPWKDFGSWFIGSQAQYPSELTQLTTRRLIWLWKDFQTFQERLQLARSAQHCQELRSNLLQMH